MSTLVLKAICFFVGLLSWRQAQKLGAILGLLWFYVVRIRRQTVFKNLAMALPELKSRHWTIAREAYRHFGISALEFFQLQQMTGEQLTTRVHSQGMEHYEAAIARGQGVIVVTAHFGNFDLLACSQAAKGVPLAIVSKELHRGGISRFWMNTRQSKGLKIFPEKGSAKQILKWLRSGKVVGLTVDQRTSKERGGICSPFFRHHVWTTTAPAALALSSGAVLLPVRVERTSDGDHHLIVEKGIIPVNRHRDTDEIRVLTEKINEIVESWVRERPEHWMWLHRRFIGSK